MAMAAPSYHKPKKATATTTMSSLTLLNTAFFFILILTVPALLFLHSPSLTTCPNPTASTSPYTSFSGDLRDAEFSWNHLRFDPARPPPEPLKLAVFSRKWPTESAPGGMERHALTLHSALARRGHQVHVFTSTPPIRDSATKPTSAGSPLLHFLSGQPGRWRPEDAWKLFEAENANAPFDAVHSESVALPHRLAHGLPNLAVSWHGIALEALQSAIVQDLSRPSSEPMSQSFNLTLMQRPHIVLNEIRFFQSYAHHVAISDSSGEMLRDSYQIPGRRVHVILNGVDETHFVPDETLGSAFRAEIGVPQNASLVMGIAGRLVKDKGHPLLFEAFSKITSKHPDVYLVVAGSGPWEKRYTSLGPRVVTLGALPPSKLKAFYNSIDVFLNPTMRPQGLDLTLMEAMQCGKPVVATRFPSIKGSVVVKEEFGHMFAPNVESLVEVLEKVVGEGASRAKERGRACRDYAAEMFSATKMAMAYERLFLCVKDERYCKYPLQSSA